MKKILIFTSLVLFTPISAWAQEIVLKHVCQDLETYSSESADYKAGVDVNGNDVAPADLKAPLNASLYPIEVPVEIDVIEWLDLDVDPRLKDAAKLEPQVATLKVFEDGRIEYNGQDISDRADYLCEDNIAKIKPSEKEPESEIEGNGQTVSDPVTSGVTLEGQLP